MKISLPCRGFNEQHTGLYVECKARWQSRREFFCKVLKAQHKQSPRELAVDKNAAYPVTMETLKRDETLAAQTELRKSKYLNNMVEQDRRAIKRIVKPMMGFKSFNTARQILSRIEAMNMIRKGLVNGID